MSLRDTEVDLIGGIPALARHGSAIALTALRADVYNLLVFPEPGAKRSPRRGEGGGNGKSRHGKQTEPLIFLP